MIEMMKMRFGKMGNDTKIKFSKINIITGEDTIVSHSLLDLIWWSQTNAYPRGKKCLTLEEKYHISEDNIKFFHDNSFGKVVFFEKKEKWEGGRQTDIILQYARPDDFLVWSTARVRTRPELWPQNFWGRGFDTMMKWFKEDPSIFLMFSDIFHDFYPPDAEHGRFEINLDLEEALPVLSFASGEKIPIVAVNAGIRRFIYIVYLLMRALYKFEESKNDLREYVVPRVVLLIDEIESHLHPKWQRIIFTKLIDSLEQIGVFFPMEYQIFFSTNSPIIIESMEPYFNDREFSLFTIKYYKNGSNYNKFIERMPFLKRGDVSMWLVTPVFGLLTPKNLESEAIIKKASKFLSNPPKDKELRRRIYEELDGEMETLGKIDPHYRRWKLVTYKKKIKGEL